MRHSWNTGAETDWVEPAIDLSAYYKSVEWDLMSVKAKKNNTLYPCCRDVPYPDVTFHISVSQRFKSEMALRPYIRCKVTMPHSMLVQKTRVFTGEATSGNTVTLFV
jgi:Neurotransmitter-gated ion-channel ligand binding domain